LFVVSCHAQSAPLPNPDIWNKNPPARRSYAKGDGGQSTDRDIDAVGSNMNAMARFLLSKPFPAPVLGVLESLRCGGFLLDPQARVLSLNSTAFGCLGNGLVLEGERLSAIDRESDRRLQTFIAAELKTGRGFNAPQSVAVQRDSRLPLVVRPHRLDDGADRAPSAAAPSPAARVPAATVSAAPIRAGLLLLVVDPEQWLAPPQDMLMQTFHLTYAEADVAIGIASSRTLAEIAIARDIKIGTVRAHLKAVFSKTHTHSQADLTGALTRLAFLAPEPRGQKAQTVARSHPVASRRHAVRG
jgi:DNA-binding CsgD family transcriptional regulator